jgi:hypothetical protein
LAIFSLSSGYSFWSQIQASSPQEKSGSADIPGMNITIHRDEVSYGPYTMEQVKAMVAKGRVGRADLACLEGGSKWEPLENLIIQESFRRQRAAYVAEMNSSPKKKKSGGKHANRWLWKPE